MSVFLFIPFIYVIIGLFVGYAGTRYVGSRFYAKAFWVSFFLWPLVLWYALIVKTVEREQ